MVVGFFFSFSYDAYCLVVAGTSRFDEQYWEEESPESGEIWRDASDDTC